MYIYQNIWWKKLISNYQIQQGSITHTAPLPEGSYCCIHDSCAMCSNWISNMPNVNSVQMFIIACSLNKNL